MPVPLTPLSNLSVVLRCLTPHFSFKSEWCPREDSNLHGLASASPSSWCDYQFHHLGTITTRTFYLKFKLGSRALTPNRLTYHFELKLCSSPLTLQTLRHCIIREEIFNLFATNYHFAEVLRDKHHRRSWCPVIIRGLAVIVSSCCRYDDNIS